MTTSATSLLGLALPVTSELAGTWGDVVNDSITSLLDTAVAGTTTLSTDGDVTLSTTTLAANQARQAILLCSGARTALRTITAPAQSKIYTIINATTGGYSVKLVGVGPTTGVTVVAGESALVAWNGSDFIKISNTGGAASFTDVTVSGNVTLSGGTANGVLYLNGSKVATSGSALTFDGTTLVSSRGASNGVAAQFGRSSGQSLYVYADTTSVYLGSDNGANTALQLNETSDYIAGWLGGSEQMRLTSTGLGIGTSSPSTKLTVYAGADGDIGFFRGGSTRQVQIGTSSTAGYINTDKGSAGLEIRTQGTARMYVDNSGNLGLGVTPESWQSGFKVVRLSGLASWNVDGSTAGSGTYFGNNVYRDATDSRWEYIVSSDNATQYLQASGQHIWRIAPSGTANTQITFTQAMTLDASGNLGLGVTPSAWSNYGPAFQIGYSGLKASYFSTTNNQVTLLNNAYEKQDTSYAYILGTNKASAYKQIEGAHQWLTAGTSGGADTAVSFTQAMTLDASGNLGIGSTSPNIGGLTRALTLNTPTGGNYSGVELAGAGTLSARFITNNVATYFGSQLSIPLIFETNATERARIDSSGNLCVGTTAASGKLSIAGSSSDAWSSTTTGGLTLNGVTSGISTISTYADDTSIRIGAGVSQKTGLLINGQSASGGSYVSVSTGGSERVRIDSSGNLGVGTTSPSNAGNSNNRGITLNGNGTAGFVELQSSGTAYGLLYGNSSEVQLRTATAIPLLFGTNGTERARIDSSGMFAVNYSSTISGGIFVASSNGTRQSLLVKNDDSVYLYSLGTGTVTCSAGVLSYSSDERLKIADGVFSGGLEAVKNIVPQYFYWKGENGQKDQNRPRELGFFAQNIQATCGKEVAPDPYREDLHMGIHDRGIMAVLVAAIQEQQALIETLTARITALESK